MDILVLEWGSLCPISLSRDIAIFNFVKTFFLFLLNLIRGPKEIGDQEPYYSTKILIFSFIWAGLADLRKTSTV